ncbi:MAG: 7TM diverse intracellular signaling domain-containing protein [Oligoflexus sp.]
MKPLRFLMFVFMMVWLMDTDCLWAEPDPSPHIPSQTLRSWEPTRDGSQSLAGDWLFFPKKFLNPKQVPANSPWPAYRAKVPGSWLTDIDLESSSTPLPANYWGTYLLKLESLPVSNQLLGINFRADTAAKVFLIPAAQPEASREILSIGKPGDSKDSSIPQLGDPLGHFQITQPGDYYLMVHISNFHWQNGGIWSGPEIGLYENMARARANRWLSDMFVIGMLFIMTIYNLSLYLHRREDIKSLLLSGHCFAVLVRSISVSSILYVWFPDSGWGIYELTRKMELAFANYSCVFLVAFIYASFRPNNTPSYVRIYFIFSTLMFLVTLLTFAEVYSNYLIAYQIPILVAALPACWLLVRSTIKKKSGARMALVGFLAILFSATHDILMGMGVIHTTFYFLPYGIALLNFTQSQVIAIMFSKAFRVAENLSRDLQREVERQTRDIRSMLDHIPEGIFRIVPPGIIDPNYSAHLSKIFKNEEIAGRRATDFIFGKSEVSRDMLSRIDSVITASLEDSIYNYEANEEHLLREINVELNEKGHRNLEISWNPIVDEDDQVEKILVTLRDVTHLKALEEQNITQRKELEYITEIVNIPKDKFDQFIEMAHKFIAENQRLVDCNPQLLPEVLKILFINMHTIKGTARSYAFHKMTGILHDIEQHYAWLLKDPEAPWDREKLNEDLSLARNIINTYEEINTNKLGRTKADHSQISMERAFLEEKLRALQQIDFSKLNHSDATLIQESLRSFDEVCYDRAIDVFENILSHTEKLAKDLGKEVPIINVKDPGFRINYNGQQLLRNIFVHIVRNSLDHGIETAKERINEQKKPTGQINVNLRTQDQFMLIEYGDDGRGLNMNGLLESARKRSLIATDLVLDLQSTAELMFHSGLSTAATVSEISGRGVGMDAVKKYLESEGGFIHIRLLSKQESTPYQQFRFEIGIPPKFFTIHETWEKAV